MHAPVKAGKYVLATVRHDHLDGWKDGGSNPSGRPPFYSYGHAGRSEDRSRLDRPSSPGKISSETLDVLSILSEKVATISGAYEPANTIRKFMRV